MTATCMQVFVYGTLRPNCGNDGLWHGLAHARHDGTARVLGHKLVTQQFGYFPYLIPASACETVGTLITAVDAVSFELMIARMDALEGVPTHYERVSVAVLVPGSIERAWTYKPVRPEHRLLPDARTNRDGSYDWWEHEREFAP